MRTRAEMKTAAKENFRRCTGVFVAAAAILIVLGGIYGGTSSSNSMRNLNSLKNSNNLTVQSSGLSSQDTAALNQFADQFVNSGAVTVTAAIVAMIVSLVGLAAAFAVAILQIGFSHMALIASAGGIPKFGDFFTPFKRFGRWLGFSLIMGLRVLAWSLLFVIPGIIAAYRYSAATYLMLEDPNMKINESLRKSGELMRGYKWKLFVLNFSFFWWLVLTGITFGWVGLYVRPYMELTKVQFYYDLRREHSVEGLPPTMAFAVPMPPQPAAPMPPQPPAPPIPVAPPAPPAPPIPPAPPADPAA